VNDGYSTARLRAVVLLMAGWAWAAPAHALFDDNEARRQAAEAHKRIDDVRRSLDESNARLAKMEEALKNQPVLELANRLELLREELKSLRGQIEVMNNAIESSAKRQRDMYVDLDTRPPRRLPPRRLHLSLRRRPLRPLPPARRARRTKRPSRSVASATIRAPSPPSSSSSRNIRRAVSPIARSTGSAIRTSICATTRTPSRASRSSSRPTATARPCPMRC